MQSLDAPPRAPGGAAPSRQGRARGFTLMEVLIVLVIIGMLAGLVGPMVYRRIKPARHQTARTQIEHFVSALNTYYIDTGAFPTPEQGLNALRHAPQGVRGWQGPYLGKEIPADPWGNPYRYRIREGGREVEVISYGADGREGGQDDDRDIVSWKND